MKKPFSIARLVTNDNRPFSMNVVVERMALIPKTAKMLTNHVDLLQTPGGFVLMTMDMEDAARGTCSSKENFKVVSEAISDTIMGDFSPALREVGKVADYVTIGVDVVDTSCKQVAAELVVTYNVKNNCIDYITGKSYPTPDQVNSLMYCIDLDTHCQMLNGHKVLVLGCHDLSMFLKRSIANINRGSGDTYKAWVVNAFHDLVADFKPGVVLHHPHTTVLTSTWKAKWSGLLDFFPYIATYSSGIHYFDDYLHTDPAKWSCLKDVLTSTMKGDVKSILCTVNECRRLEP